MALAFFLNAVCLFLVLTLGRTSGAWFTVTLALTFFTWGEIFSLFPSTCADWFGSRHATSNYAFLYTAKGVASILAGGVAAVLYQQFGSWSAAFYGSAALALLAGMMAVGLRSRPAADGHRPHVRNCCAGSLTSGEKHVNSQLPSSNSQSTLSRSL